MTGLVLAMAAEALVGCRFRLHGRDPATGLDCLGVFAAAMKATGRSAWLPAGYSLRTGQAPDLDCIVGRSGLAAASGDIEPGDVLMSRPGPGQFHLMIASRKPDWVVEAHAGLRRVVLRPHDPRSIVHRWRLTAQA